MPHNNAKDIFENLVGKWQFERQISTGEQMKGEAEFKKRENYKNCMAYEESGIRHLGGKKIEFSQKYFYYLVENKITIHNFKDEPMHDLSFNSEMVGDGGYMCGLDRYDCVLTFQDNNHFTMQYTVISDRDKIKNKKDYIAVTQFEK